MKRKCWLLSVMMLALSGVAWAADNIESVKNEILPNFPSTTIGKAIDNYSFFNKTDWHVIQTQVRQITPIIASILSPSN